MQITHTNQIDRLISNLSSSVLPDHLARTLSVIVNHCNLQDGQVFTALSLEKIAKLRQKSVRTISKHIKALSDLNYITKKKDRWQESKWLHNVYYIQLSTFGIVVDKLKSFNCAKDIYGAFVKRMKRSNKQRIQENEFDYVDPKMSPFHAALLRLQDGKPTKSDVYLLKKHNHKFTLTEKHFIKVLGFKEFF